MQQCNVLLYVDDCHSVAWLVKRFFEKRFPTYEIVLAANAADAWKELEARRDTPEFIRTLVADIRLGPSMDGLALVQKVRATFPKVRTIVVSGMIGAEEARRAYAAGAHAVIEKDLNAAHFVDRLFDLASCAADQLPESVPATAPRAQA
jgi:DNA-binding NtrC family response regulator